MLFDIAVPLKTLAKEMETETKRGRERPFAG